MTFAAAWNQPAVVKLLLDAGANPNLADRGGGTALMLAALNGTADMVGDLLSAKADPDQRDKNGNDPLTHARRRKDSDAEGKTIATLLRRATGPTGKTNSAYNKGRARRVLTE